MIVAERNTQGSNNSCEEMIRLVKPGEAIIPIHTEKKEMFSKLDMPCQLATGYLTYMKGTS